MPQLIGYASWQGPTVAELWGDNVWVCRVAGVPDATLERNLTALYADRVVYDGPSNGYYGFSVLRDLAEQMGGRFSFNMPPPSEGGIEF